MKKLIGMTEMLPEHPHSIFLKQKPEIWMFVACDEDGNILEEPNKHGLSYKEYNEEYQQAQERVIFDGFEVDKMECGHKYAVNNNLQIVNDGELGLCIYEIFPTQKPKEVMFKTIEDLVKYNLILK